MPRYVLVDAGAVVRNIIEWDGVTPIVIPIGQTAQRTDADAEIGKTLAQSAIPAPIVPARNSCAITADVETLSAAFGDAVGLALDLAPNTTYAFEFRIAFRSAALTTGLGLAVAAPALPVMLAYQREIPTGLTATVLQQGFANDGTATASTGVDAAATDRYATLSGLIQTGAAGGLLQLRFKTEVANSKIIVRAGSCGWLQKMAS
jgi:hypothetical protein